MDTIDALDKIGEPGESTGGLGEGINSNKPSISQEDSEFLDILDEIDKYDK